MCDWSSKRIRVVIVPVETTNHYTMFANLTVWGSVDDFKTEFISSWNKICERTISIYQNLSSGMRSIMSWIEVLFKTNKFSFLYLTSTVCTMVPDRANNLKTFVQSREAMIYGFCVFVDRFFLGDRIKQNNNYKKIQGKLEKEYKYKYLKLFYPTWCPIVNYFDVENDS